MWLSLALETQGSGRRQRRCSVEVGRHSRGCSSKCTCHPRVQVSKSQKDSQLEWIIEPFVTPDPPPPDDGILLMSHCGACMVCQAPAEFSTTASHIIITIALCVGYYCCCHLIYGENEVQRGVVTSSGSHSKQVPRKRFLISLHD